jgi:hypothetical protein
MSFRPLDDDELMGVDFETYRGLASAPVAGQQTDRDVGVVKRASGKAAFSSPAACHPPSGDGRQLSSYAISCWLHPTFDRSMTRLCIAASNASPYSAASTDKALHTAAPPCGRRTRRPQKRPAHTQKTLEKQRPRSAMPFADRSAAPIHTSESPRWAAMGVKPGQNSRPRSSSPGFPRADIGGRRRGTAERDVSGVPRPGRARSSRPINGSPYGAISGVRHATRSIGFVAARVSGSYGRRVRRSATLDTWSRRQTVLADVWLQRRRWRVVGSVRRPVAGRFRSRPTSVPRRPGRTPKEPRATPVTGWTGRSRWSWERSTGTPSPRPSGRWVCR